MAPLGSLLLSRRCSLLFSRLTPATPTPRPLPTPHGLTASPYKAVHTTTDPQPFSSFLVPADHTATSTSEDSDSIDEKMSDFLSRFVHKMRHVIVDSYPGIDRPTRDGMLLVIADRVASRLERSAGGHGEILGLGGSASSLASDPSLELSPHLWVAAWEVSGSVLEDMRKARKRELMKRFLHTEGVKGMCRFAAEVGIRGDMLREFRFKWALEEMEEWEFSRGLGDMGREARWREGNGKVGTSSLITERKGRIAYRIRGLDLSDPKWMEATERVEEAEKRIEAEELKPLMGKSRMVTERILGLDQNEDPAAVLAEWAVVLEPKRADWMALLDRIKDRNQLLYFKVAEFLLDEESFQPTIRDYSRLLEAYSDADKMEDAERILQKMIEKDIRPDILTSIILIHMYSRVGNLNRAKEEFQSLQKIGFQPNHKVYESMIRENLKSGNGKDAEILMKEMEHHDMKPPKDIYTEILRVYSQHGQADGAQRIVNTMQYAGIPQTLESTALLIEAHGHAGDSDLARHNFDLMRRSGQRPDDRCTASVIAAYEKRNLLDKALDLLLNLEKDGFKPGITTYSVLVDWLGRLLLVEEVEQLLEKIAEKGDLPFNSHVGLCDMYSRAGVEDKAKKSLKILLAKNEQLKGAEFERIINGLLAGGFTQEAKRVNGAMLAQGFESSEATKMALMTADIIPCQRPSFRK